MTWDEICRNADGAIFGERSLKVKDNARENVRGLIIGLTGIDVECDEYVIFVHRTADRDKAEDAVQRIGYRYKEVADLAI